MWKYLGLLFSMWGWTAVFAGGATLAPGLNWVDEYTVVGEGNFLTGFLPVNPDGTINVVIEIPAGSVAKWEVRKSDGALVWEFKRGKPRVVKYLAYPANYGMVPGTLLPEDMGGDGDPLDVIALGRSLPRGTVVKARLIGVLKLVDRGEQDDKLVAVPSDTVFRDVDDIDALRREFIGTTDIIKTWFTSYKGAGEIVSPGFGDIGEARAILNSAIKAFQTRRLQ